MHIDIGMHTFTEISKSELEALVAEWFPLTLRMSNRNKGRILELDSLEGLELVEGVGARVRCTGGVSWNTFWLPKRTRIEALEVCIALALRDSDEGLMVEGEVEFETFSIAGMPDWVDRRVASMCEKVVSKKIPSAIALSRHLDIAGTLPESLGGREVRLRVPDGALQIGSECLRIRLDGDVTLAQDAA